MLDMMSVPEEHTNLSYSGVKIKKPHITQRVTLCKSGFLLRRKFGEFSLVKEILDLRFNIMM